MESPQGGDELGFQGRRSLTVFPFPINRALLKNLKDRLQALTGRAGSLQDLFLQCDIDTYKNPYVVIQVELK